MVDGFKTVRWKRYGKDRLYVNGDNGRPVGWVEWNRSILADVEHG